MIKKKEEKKTALLRCPEYRVTVGTPCCEAAVIFFSIFSLIGYGNSGIAVIAGLSCRVIIVWVQTDSNQPGFADNS